MEWFQNTFLSLVISFFSVAVVVIALNFFLFGLNDEDRMRESIEKRTGLKINSNLDLNDFILSERLNIDKLKVLFKENDYKKIRVVSLGKAIGLQFPWSNEHFLRKKLFELDIPTDNEFAYWPKSWKKED